MTSVKIYWNLEITMAAFVRTARSASRADFDAEVVKILMIFSGCGLLLSLLLAMNGMDSGFQAMF
jgi:hypothetical protein